MANLFYLPYRPIHDGSGLIAPGAQVLFTQTGSNTLKPIYSNSGLSVQLSNPVVADGVGTLPTIYMDPATTYRVRIYAKNATPLVDSPIKDYSPYVPGFFADAGALQPVADAAEESATTASDYAAAAAASAASVGGVQAATEAAAAEATAALTGIEAAIAGLPAGTLPVVLASRLLMAAQASPTLGTQYLLTESGRLGLFEAVASAGYAALIAADTAQGLIVVSSTDATKAYKRHIEKDAEGTWFGMASSASAATNTAALNAALAALKAAAITGQGYNTGSIGLHIPAGTGEYLLNAEIVPDHALDIYGDFVASGGGTVLRWTSNTSGFGLRGDTGNSNGAHIRNFILKGTNAGANCHAVNQLGYGRVSDCYISGWSGDAIFANGTPPAGLSGSVWSNVSADDVGWTLHIDGSDSNGCESHNIGCGNNRFGGILDSSGIGCRHFPGVINGCGLVSGYKTRCYNNGHIFMVAYGQEAGASANSPPSTATSNTYWLYLFDAAASATQPQWTAAQTWYFSAPICIDPTDNNIRSVIVGGYVESGLNKIIVNNVTNFLPGQWLVGVALNDGNTAGGGFIGNGIFANFPNGIQVNGFGSHFGPPTNPGVATDLTVQLNNWNEYNILDFYRQGAQVGRIWSAGVGSILHDFDTHTFRAKAGGSAYYQQLTASGNFDYVARGYPSGAGIGGSVTQLTSKSTAVILNKLCGQITMHNASLGANAAVSFTLTNSMIEADDEVQVWVKSGATANAYIARAQGNASGSREIMLYHFASGSLSEAVVLGFSVKKAAIT